MKTFLPIVLAFFVLYQCTVKTIVIIGFYINKEYIVQNLCENKDNTAMHCDGKCYLKKQLQNEERKSIPLADILKKKEELFFANDKKIDVPKGMTISVCSVIVNNERPLSACAGGVFRPPELC